MSDYDPTNHDQPSKSIFGPNPRFVLGPLIVGVVSGLFLLVGWLLHG